MGMEAFDWSIIFSLDNLLAIIIGSLAGLVLGAIPGMGSMILLAILLPFTYLLEPAAAVLLMMSAYQAGEYGGSISSVILGIPGTPSAAATVLDGHTYAQNKSPGRALAYSLQASLIGALLGSLVLIFFAGPLTDFALRWSAPEYFLVGVLGILAVATLSSKDKLKSMISMILGLMVATIGVDIFSGAPRFTIGFVEFLSGVSMIALIIGVFGIPEIIKMLIQKDIPIDKSNKDNFSGKLKLQERIRVLKKSLLGGTVGVGVGIFPGLGAGTASWFGYALAKKTSKNPETFGKGNPDGIIGPESANNGAVGGALLPLLALGIPGSPAIAIIAGAFIMQGITPGPGVFNNETDLVNAILFGYLIAAFVMFILGRFLTPVFARVISIPNIILAPSVLLITIIGIYISEGMIFNLWVALLIGLIAYILIKLDFSVPSFVLAFVLGPIIETNFRRALDMAQGDFTIFVTRPISLVILLLILGILFYPVLSRLLKKAK